MIATNNKPHVRKMALAHRRRLPPDQVTRAGRLIHGHLLKMPDWDLCASIHTYVEALPGEIPTLPLIQMALALDRQVTIPVVDAVGELRHSLLTDPADLRRGYMKLWEPQTPAWVEELADLDLILVPGAAFDRGGHRVGLGGGYYDRLLQELPASTRRIGVIYDAWLLDRVPTEPHDQPVDMICTESGLYPAEKESP